jgi:biopolymer transport protein ExbB/TolQ
MKFFDRFFKKNNKDSIKVKVSAKLEGYDEIKEQIAELEKRLKNLKVIISVGD